MTIETSKMKLLAECKYRRFDEALEVVIRAAEIEAENRAYERAAEIIADEGIFSGEKITPFRKLLLDERSRCAAAIRSLKHPEQG